MAESRAASRYVKSLLGLAVEQNALEDVHRDMLFFSSVASQNRPLVVLLQNPIIKHDVKLTVLKRVFHGRVHQLTMSFFEIIVRKNRESILVEIAREFHNAYNQYKGIGRATITTAIPLEPKLRAEFEKLVKAYIDKKNIELVEKVDPALIGGFILNIGDRQVDASIRNKIKTLQVHFSQNPYIKEL